MKYKISLAFLLFIGSSLLVAEEAMVDNVEGENQQALQQAKEQAKETSNKQINVAEEQKPSKRSTSRLERETEKQSEIDPDDALAKKIQDEAKEKAIKDILNKEKKAAEEEDPVVEALNKEQKLLLLENIVKEERLKKENEGLREKLQRLKWQKEELNAELDLAALKDEVKNQAEAKKHAEKLLKLTREAELADERSRKLTSELETQRLESELKTSKLRAEIEAFQVEKDRESYANNKPVYLDNPVVNGDTLVISDRRVEMNDLITSETADYISTRINYYNNKDATKPIFLVIDSSPGGSAMAGYRIIKAMQASKAPVYVVVKSLAASMAAIITTMADNSFAYPNAVIVHHQLSLTIFLARLNVTQQKEMYEDSKKWWERMMTPIAKKMGITTDEFIKKMYEKSSSGDWSEFATEAKALKWVNNIVERIEETSLITDPDVEEKEEFEPLREVLTSEGRAVVYLPHLAPKDAYFVYNPDQYYQMR